MAAQCGGVNGAQQAPQQQQQRTFVSSSAYYGYVPLRLPEGAAAPADMDVDLAPQLRRLKRGFAPDELAAYVPRFKRFREEAVVTNVFSMVQQTASGQKGMDWPRCTMSRQYYA